MKDRKQAEDACKDPNPHIDGRKANVNLAYLGQKPRNNPHSTNHSSKASPGNNSPATFQPIASQPSNFLSSYIIIDYFVKFMAKSSIFHDFGNLLARFIHRNQDYIKISLQVQNTLKHFDTAFGKWIGCF